MNTSFALLDLALTRTAAALAPAMDVTAQPQYETGLTICATVTRPGVDCDGERPALARGTSTPLPDTQA